MGRPTTLIKDGSRQCIKCLKVKVITDFYKDAHLQSGFRSVCKRCDKDYKRWWKKENRTPETCNEMSAISYVLSIAKARAKLKNIPFNLEAADITPAYTCPILDVPISPFNPDRRYTWSLDRRDPDLGYVKGNVFILSNRANTLKSNATVAQLQALINYMQGNRN